MSAAPKFVVECSEEVARAADRPTPGPWAVHPHFAHVVPAEHVTRPIGGASDDVVDLRDYAQEICAMHWPDRHRSQSEVRANARLIAAAPELFEALREFVRACDDEPTEMLARALVNVRAQALAALAKVVSP